MRVLVAVTHEAHKFAFLFCLAVPLKRREFVAWSTHEILKMRIDLPMFAISASQQNLKSSTSGSVGDSLREVRLNSGLDVNQTSRQ